MRTAGPSQGARHRSAQRAGIALATAGLPRLHARGPMGLPRRLLGLAIAVGGLGLLAGQALAPWLG